jgi:hypothetical protein
MLLLSSGPFSGIYKFDTTLLKWSKVAYLQSDIPRGILASSGGKVLLCGNAGGEKLLFQ